MSVFVPLYFHCNTTTALHVKSTRKGQARYSVNQTNGNILFICLMWFTHVCPLEAVFKWPARNSPFIIKQIKNKKTNNIFKMSHPLGFAMNILGCSIKFLLLNWICVLYIMQCCFEHNSHARYFTMLYPIEKIPVELLFPSSTKLFSLFLPLDIKRWKNNLR